MLVPLGCPSTILHIRLAEVVEFVEFIFCCLDPLRLLPFEEVLEYLEDFVLDVCGNSFEAVDPPLPVLFFCFLFRV